MGVAPKEDRRRWTVITGRRGWPDAIFRDATDEDLGAL